MPLSDAVIDTLLAHERPGPWDRSNRGNLTRLYGRRRVAVYLDPRSGGGASGWWPPVTG